MLREMPRRIGRPQRKPLRGRDARNKIAEDNSRLVGWAVTRFFRNLDNSILLSYSRDDANGDAWVGLLRACELWNPARGALSAYSWYWMRQAMQGGLQIALNLIRVPSRHPEARIHCAFKDDWADGEVPVDRGEDAIVALCRVDAMDALEQALLVIDRKQAMVIRMRLGGSTWTEVSKKLRASIPRVQVIEGEGKEALQRELEHIRELL